MVTTYNIKHQRLLHGHLTSPLPEASHFLAQVHYSIALCDVCVFGYIRLPLAANTEPMLLPMEFKLF